MKQLNQYEIEQVSGAFLAELISGLIGLFVQPQGGSIFGQKPNDNISTLPLYVPEGILSMNKTVDAVTLPFYSQEPIIPASKK